MKTLTRFQVAAIKRTYQNVKSMVAKREKLAKKMEELASEMLALEAQIDAYEQPILAITGGLTSSQMAENGFPNTVGCADCADGETCVSSEELNETPEETPKETPVDVPSDAVIDPFQN